MANCIVCARPLRPAVNSYTYECPENPSHHTAMAQFIGISRQGERAVEKRVTERVHVPPVERCARKILQAVGLHGPHPTREELEPVETLLCALLDEYRPDVQYADTRELMRVRRAEAWVEAYKNQAWTALPQAQASISDAWEDAMKRAYGAIGDKDIESGSLPPGVGPSAMEQQVALDARRRQHVADHAARTWTMKDEADHIAHQQAYAEYLNTMAAGVAGPFPDVTVPFPPTTLKRCPQCGTHPGGPGSTPLNETDALCWRCGDRNLEPA